MLTVIYLFNNHRTLYIRSNLLPTNDATLQRCTFKHLLHSKKP